MEKMSTFESACIESMRTLLTDNCDINMFSIGYPIDSAICIIKEDGKWHVFDCTRNTRDCEDIFENPALACMEVISRIFPRESEPLLTDFLNSVYEEKVA